MPTIIGSREIFAFDFDPEPAPHGLQRVDIWVAGIRLTCDDNSPYMPQFWDSVESTLCHVLSGRGLVLTDHSLTVEELHRRAANQEDGYERHRFMYWGPTTDNISSFIFLRDGNATITFEFWRESDVPREQLVTVFSVTLPKLDLMWIILQFLNTVPWRPESYLGLK